MKLREVIWFFILSSCVSVKQYRNMEVEIAKITEAKKIISKEIRTIEKANKFLEDSITRNIERYATLSHQIEKRLSKYSINVKLDPNELEALAVYNQNMDEDGYSYLIKTYSYNDTNSARKTEWLSKNERALIYWLNYARLNPKQFCMKYILKKNKVQETNVYIATLLDYMLTMKPVPALIPDKKLFESALCHAESMGKAGLIGHNRLTGCKSTFSGECCSYGLSNPLDIVIQLLIDEGVSSLGHRYICLGSYSKVGISIKPHQSWGTNCVLDFGYGVI